VLLALPRIQIFISAPSSRKNPLACQEQKPRSRIADSNSRNAVSFLSARTTNGFPSRDAVIRVYDAAGNVMETHEHKGEFREW